MPYTFEVSDSKNKNKKLKVLIYKDGNKVKTLHVGENRYADYIEYYRSGASFANERKRLYLLLHLYLLLCIYEYIHTTKNK
jgi:hypothetical protein